MSHYGVEKVLFSFFLDFVRLYILRETPTLKEAFGSWVAAVHVRASWDA